MTSNLENVLLEIKYMKDKLAILEDKVRSALPIGSGGGLATATSFSPSSESSAPTPGITGIFNGVEMVTSAGLRYAVSPAYAAKSLLVPGDSLSMSVEEEKNVFKQVSKTPRITLDAVVANKDGELVAACEFGTFRFIQGVVSYHALLEGSNVTIIISAKEKGHPGAYCALDKKPARTKSETFSKEGHAAKEPAPTSKAPSSAVSASVGSQPAPMPPSKVELKETPVLEYNPRVINDDDLR